VRKKEVESRKKGEGLGEKKEKEKERNTGKQTDLEAAVLEGSLGSKAGLWRKGLQIGEVGKEQRGWGRLAISTGTKLQPLNRERKDSKGGGKRPRRVGGGGL